MINEILMSLTSDIFIRDRRFFVSVPKYINDVIYMVKDIDLNDKKCSTISYDDRITFMLIDGVTPKEDIYDIIPSPISNNLTFVIYTEPFMKEPHNYGLYAKVVQLYEAIINLDEIKIKVNSSYHSNTIAYKFQCIAANMFAIKSLQALLSDFTKADVLRYYSEYDKNIRITNKALDEIFKTPWKDMAKGAAWEYFDKTELVQYTIVKDDEPIDYLAMASRANTAQTFKTE